LISKPHQSHQFKNIFLVFAPSVTYSIVPTAVKNNKRNKKISI
jgi:hypothetical protein